jgi:hypothetical protein
MVPRRMFGPKKNETVGSWRKLHKEELHEFHSSPNIIRTVELRRIRLAENVARMERILLHTSVWWEDQRERDN